jgi:hypothetical protein
MGSFHLLDYGSRIINGIGNGLSNKTLEWVSYHAPTVTLTWLERDEHERSCHLRCCPLPTPFCAPLGVEINLLSPQPYSPDTLVTTLFRWHSLCSSPQDFLILEPIASSPSLTPFSSAGVAHWLFATQIPEIPQPLRSDFSRGSSDRLVEHESRLTVIVIDFSTTALSRASLPLPVLDETFTLSGLISTSLPHTSSAASLATSLLVVQFDSLSTSQTMCFLYLLDLSASGSILFSKPQPFDSTPQGTRLSSCHIDKNHTVLILHQPNSTNEQPIISHLPLATLLRDIKQQNSHARWSRYLVQSSLRGQVVGLVVPKQDIEWALEVKNFYYQPLVHLCLFTSCGELLEVDRTILSSAKESTIAAVPQTPPTTASPLPPTYSLRAITDKLFLTNKLLNPNPPPLSDLIKDIELYVPHAWYHPLSNPQSSDSGSSFNDDPQRSFHNSIFLASNTAILPPHSTLLELWKNQAVLQLSIFVLPDLHPPLLDSSATASPLPASPPASVPIDDESLIRDLLFTIFTSDPKFLQSTNSLRLKGLARSCLLARYFIDPSPSFGFRSNRSSDGLELEPFSVRYLDLQELFISCEYLESTEEEEEIASLITGKPMEEYLELCLWYLWKHSPASLVNFIYEILCLLSSKRLTSSQGGDGTGAPYNSLKKLNKHQRQVHRRCLSFLEQLSLPTLASLPQEMCWKDEIVTKAPLNPQQRMSLLLCSFANDSVLRIVKRLCHWNRRDLVLQFVCPIFTEYNTTRVRLCLGDRWNRCGSPSHEEEEKCMRWINPLDDEGEDKDVDDQMAMVERDGAVSDSGGTVLGEDDWGNTWQDASGSEPDQPLDGDLVSVAGETTCGTVIGILDWDDVESDDEEESEQICWKHFCQDSRLIFISCLRSCLLAGDLTSACQLITCRPVEAPCHELSRGDEREGVGESELSHGITDLDIVLLFEELYEEQMTKRKQSQTQGDGKEGEDERGEAASRRGLTVGDLRVCIESFPCR